MGLSELSTLAQTGVFGILGLALWIIYKMSQLSAEASRAVAAAMIESARINAASQKECSDANNKMGINLAANTEVTRSLHTLIQQKLT